MGTVIEFHQVADEEAMLSRLLVYMKAIQKMLEPKSISKELAEGLLACKPNRRSMKLEQIFNAVLDKYSELISFKPIESTIQLLETADKKVAQDMVQTYVMSNNMAESIKATVIDQLQMEEVVDNKAVMIVGNYGIYDWYRDHSGGYQCRRSGDAAL